MKISRLLLILFGILACVVLGAGGVIFARYRIAAAYVAAEKPVATDQLRDFGSTRKLTILPVYEGAAVNGLEWGHGVSYVIQTDQAQILLDFGYNPSNTDPTPLEINFKRLGLRLEDMDAVVISHAHPDHLGGTTWWQKGTFSIQKDSQPSLGSIPVYIPSKLSYPGTEPILVNRAMKIAAGIASTGSLYFLNPFPISILEPTGKEQILAVQVEGQGIVLITGCGHPGLEKIVEYAQSLFSEPIVGVVGGLHYMGLKVEKLQAHIAFLQGLNPRLVALSPHDSDPPHLEAFRKAFADQYQELQVGKAIQFP